MKNKILSALPGDHPWRGSILWFDCIGSTNDRAKALAFGGAPHGTVLIADQQTGGRGRMGRSFQSPAGCGVYMSVILRPGCTPDRLMHLTCAAAVAMCEAVEAAAGFRPGIKWTNDLVFQGKKLGGILTELSADPHSGLIQHAIVGIGINCSQKAEDFSPELRDMAASLSMIAERTVDRSRLAAAMVQALSRMDAMLLTEKAAVIKAYTDDCITVGQDIVLLRSQQRRYGKAIGIDPDGGLIITFRDGSTETVNSGEVSIRGMYGYV